MDVSGSGALNRVDMQSKEDRQSQDCVPSKNLIVLFSQKQYLYWWKYEGIIAMHDFKQVSFSRWPDAGIHLLPLLQQIEKKLLLISFNSSREVLFGSNESGCAYVFIEQGGFEKHIKEIVHFIEKEKFLTAKEVSGNTISPDQLYKRSDIPIFEIHSSEKQNDKISSIYICCGDASEIKINKDEIESYSSKMKSATDLLIKKSISIGLNPMVAKKTDLDIFINLNLVETKDFVEIACEVADSHDHLILHNAQGKIISSDRLRSRSVTGRFRIVLQDTSLEKPVNIGSINIDSGKKIRRIEKEEKFIKIYDRGVASNLFKRIMQRCFDSGINVNTGGNFIHGNPRINVAKEMYPSFRRLVKEIESERVDIIALDLKGDYIAEDVFKDLDYDDSFDIGVISHVNESTYYYSCVEVACWHPLIRNDRVLVGCNRPSAHVGRIDKFSDIAEYSSISDITSPFKDPMIHEFPIDVVYTWVDGHDQKWINSKKQFEKTTNTHQGKEEFDTPGRWHNRDELRYSIRSLEMFASFVRNIYIVTCGQCPDWLDQSNPRIKIIDHKDIFSDKKDLPTFNSHSIECNIHRIEGLSEHFIYLNDDMLLGHLCCPDDFFEANGIAKIHPEPLYIVPELIVSKDAEYIHAGKNVVNIFRDNYDCSPKNTMQHIPYSVRKSVMFDLEKKFKNDFSRTSSNRFRSKSDISPISFLYCHYAFLTGVAVIGESTHRYIPLWSRDLKHTLHAVENDRRYKFICLNDTTVLPSDQDSTDKILSAFLDKYFPVKSSFEL